MFFPQGFFFVFLTFLKVSEQAADDGIPPVLTINIADVELAEFEDARKRLGTGPVVTCEDADGDPIRAYIESILPTSGCGLDCLQLEPTSATNFKLMYQPASGFGAAPSYTLTIACTDDLEAPVKQVMGVTIVTNTPPSFKKTSPDQTSINAQKTTHDTNSKIYEVKTEDLDDDPVYYTMATDPTTDLIEIEYASGQIRAVQDLRLLCETLVTASVSITDRHSSSVGPFVVEITIDKNNVRPSITNLDTTIQVNENTPADTEVLAFNIVDGKIKDFTYYQLSLTPEGMESYYVDGNSLKTRVALNYEREKQRSAKLYFWVDDGYCRSEVYSLIIEVLDLPEAPVLTPREMFIEVYEGEINVASNVFVYDEDLDETHTFSKDAGDDEFDIDPTTGNIVSVGEVLLKKNTKWKDYDIKMIVTDKDGLSSARYTAKIRVYDANLNRPYFTHNTLPLRLSALDCTPPGAKLGKLQGKDDDSQWNQNSWYYFTGGGAILAVAANGNIYITEYCINGESYSGSATISDQGFIPGPLTGETIEMILDCGPCPPEGYTESNNDDDDDDTVTATTVATNTTTDNITTTAAPAPTTAANIASSRGLTHMQDWLIPALLGASVWLALTGVFIYLFCPPIKCGNPLPKTKTVNVYPEPQPKAPVARQRLPPAPPQANKQLPLQQPPLPAKPVTPGDPYLHDFWKENYNNQDTTQYPNRRAMPTSIENSDYNNQDITQYPNRQAMPTSIENMPMAEKNAPPPNLRLGPPGTNTDPRGYMNGAVVGNGTTDAAAAATPKGKGCNIL